MPEGFSTLAEGMGKYDIRREGQIQYPNAGSLHEASAFAWDVELGWDLLGLLYLRWVWGDGSPWVVSYLHAISTAVLYSVILSSNCLVCSLVSLRSHLLLAPRRLGPTKQK